MGLTNMNNANNQISQVKAIQLENEVDLWNLNIIDMPYEIVAKDNWDNYLTNKNIT